jgi:hypothetical protein
MQAVEWLNKDLPNLNSTDCSENHGVRNCEKCQPIYASTVLHMVLNVLDT